MASPYINRLVNQIIGIFDALLRQKSDVAINNVIDNVKNKLVSMNLADRDYFLDKIDCFCLVSKFE